MEILKRLNYKEVLKIGFFREVCNGDVVRIKW